jgi:hypothetical protein
MRKCKVHDNEESTTRWNEWKHGHIVKKKKKKKKKWSKAKDEEHSVFLAPQKQIRMRNRDTNRVGNNENE